MTTTTERRTIAPDEIIIVTADKIADTGTVNYVFMMELPEDIVGAGALRLPWGYVWQPRMDEPGYSFNVFKSGSGLQVGGGWTPSDTPEWQKGMLDALPSCVLLMRTAIFDWLDEHLFKPYGRKYTRHHVDKIIATS
jgi:hypothetical protein